MMKKIVLMCFITTIFTSPMLQAAPPAKKSEQAPASKEFVLNPNQSTSQILKLLKSSRDKARITVVLQSGKEYSGKLGEVGQSAFTLMVDGKDFFDVVIGYNQVEAVEIQMRNLQ